MKIKKSNAIIAIFFLTISFLTILESFQVKKHISIAEYLTPLNTSVYLQTLGWLVAFVTILFIMKEILFPSPSMTGTGRSGTKIRDAVMTMTIYTVYVLSMVWLGYTLSTILFYFVFLRWIGRYPYRKTLTISIIATVCSDLIFIKGFAMMPPAGIIENLFF